MTRPQQLDRSRTAWQDNTDLFRDYLTWARKVEEYVALMFQQYGLEVVLPPLEFRKDITDVGRFAKHQADILVEGRVVEVKGQPWFWDSPAGLANHYRDHPDNFFIDRVDKVRRKQRTPVAWVFCSWPSKALLWVEHQPERWTAVLHTDPKRNLKNVETYTARERDLKSWDSLIERFQDYRSRRQP